MNRFKAVIFDLDGTLIDSKEDLGLATNRVLCGRGYAAWPVEQYGIFMGHGLRALTEQALPEASRTNEEIDRCHALILEDYGRNCMVKTRLYAGIDKVLDYLAEKGVRMGVLTNKPHAIACRIVEGLLGAWHFDFVQGGQEGLPLKPEPDGVHRFCRQVQVEPGETLFVGDSDVDVMTASNAGLCCLGVSWGFRGRRELEEAGAWRVIDKAEEMIGL
ncbi:MAG: HAD family hydrolase, partial [Bacteroidales bacterium]|nr:HAD family hydrolase [Bacteroidales bacterium]